MDITKEDIDKVIENYKKEKLSKTYLKWYCPVKYFKDKKIKFSKNSIVEKVDGSGIPVYRNLLTGYNQTRKPANARIFTPHSYEYIWLYWDSMETYYDFVYIESLDKLAVIFYKYILKSTFMIKINDYDNFKTEIRVVFIDKNKEMKMYWLSDKEYVSDTITPTQFNCETFNYIYSHLIDGDDRFGHAGSSDSFRKETARMFPYAFIGGNNYQPITNTGVLMQYLRKRPLKNKSGAMQNLVNELCSLPLPPIEEKTLRKKTVPITIIANKVKDGLAVLRWVYYNQYLDTFYETSRLYIQKEGLTFCRKDISEDFIYTKSNLSVDNFKCDAFIIKNRNCFKGTPVEYFTEALKKVRRENAASLLETFLNYPIVEKMWHIERYRNIILEYFNKTIQHRKRSFKDYLAIDCLLGPCDLSAKNPQKAFGLNNYQIEHITQFNKNNKKAEINIAFIKKFYETNDIASIDNNSFDSLCELYNKKSWYTYKTEDLVHTLKTVYSAKIAISMIKSIQKISPDFTLLLDYCDYINMVDELGDTKNFRPQFTSKREITEMHDAIISILNLKETKAKEDAFKKRLSKWNKWNFDADDTFISINPTIPAELANEGLALHHCVKNYIDRVADKETNIMFIRKKNEPDKPFFTVEITNDNKIQQVHGFGNRNANTEPGLEDYVKEWAKNCKLKLTNFNKIR